MSTFKLLGAAAILSAAIGTPASAQHVVYEPAYCAFYYPNANCQNEGPGNPLTDPNFRSWNGRNDRAGETVGIAPKHLRKHHSHVAATRMQ
jgi:hypothetical protein